MLAKLCRARSAISLFWTRAARCRSSRLVSRRQLAFAQVDHSHVLRGVEVGRVVCHGSSPFGRSVEKPDSGWSQDTSICGGEG